MQQPRTTMDTALWAAQLLWGVFFSLSPILPAMSGVKPKLTPFAAFGLTLVMRAAFIAYGRLFVRPIAPTSVSVFHALKGLAVLGALVLVDAAPVWHSLTLIH